jgi:hypothetical protein
MCPGIQDLFRTLRVSCIKTLIAAGITVAHSSAYCNFLSATLRSILGS